jgi:hypothetical protein
MTKPTKRKPKNHMCGRPLPGPCESSDGEMEKMGMAPAGNNLALEKTYRQT